MNIDFSIPLLKQYVDAGKGAYFYSLTEARDFCRQCGYTDTTHQIHYNLNGRYVVEVRGLPLKSGESVLAIRRVGE